ncbi:ATP-binding protein [Terrabacter sp. BE26]|uniref:ATP-binding protein n=1 Tax=Terrabacter sp. BE26 TaxID=2898152 RepID=UPI0035BE875F
MRPPAEARNLVQVRSSLRRWLHEVDASEQQVDEVLVACREACANVVQHAYCAMAASGDLLVEARLLERTVDLRVRDEGQWRPATDRGGGWGLQLMRALMDEVEVEHTMAGTTAPSRRSSGSRNGCATTARSCDWWCPARPRLGRSAESPARAGEDRRGPARTGQTDCVATPRRRAR